MDYSVGFTNRHLYQRVNERVSSRSSIEKRIKLQHGIEKSSTTDNFSVLKKCRDKLDCLIYELAPSLNVQFDSIRAKLSSDD